MERQGTSCVSILIVTVFTTAAIFGSAISANGQAMTLGGSGSSPLIAPPSTYSPLVNFDRTNGAQPYTENLVQGKDGNLYGTTLNGGLIDAGTIFKITPSGTLTTLLSFDGVNNGEEPFAGLVLGVDGNFYGTAFQGGANSVGTVFKITPAGTLTILHAFAYTDGGYPEGALIQGTDKNFYGTTSYSVSTPYGTVFKMSPSGTLTTLVFFDNTNGSGPLAGLAQGSDGNFYGTTADGGANGLGTVFKVTPSGVLTSLHSFDGTDGSKPECQLIQAANGIFYGTTLGGGANGDGEVFQITSAGTLTVLHSFDLTDGDAPFDGLMQATDGNLYGTSSAGGTVAGTIFEITAGGTLTTLYDFLGVPNGYEPTGGLVQYTNGAFYGTTYTGGTSGIGTVFELSTGLGPFVKLMPSSGPVGATITILGDKLSTATAVRFNGVSATFTPGSNSFLTAVVPAGATTGKVTVTVTSGTLKSNVSFRVTP